MRLRPTWPVALTVAGSDSGGGAGIQADLKTFAVLRVHGTTALTCVTAQNPRGVRAIQACRPAIVRAQIEAVVDALPPRAVKTGMLYNQSIIRTVADSLAQLRVPIVVDPVMVATSGARLLQPSAIDALIRFILPKATLVTPNLDETAILWGKPVRGIEEARLAATQLCERFGCAFLVKGGHFRGSAEAVDVLAEKSGSRILRARFVPKISTHGTGCTYAAAIAAYCARGSPLSQAVERAKAYITRAIRCSVRIGHHSALGWNG